jgi:hypothetical protein
MKAAWTVLTGVLSMSLFAVPLAGEAQPALEQFRFDPSRLCLRDAFRWGVSYRGLPGGLAAVKDVVMVGSGRGPASDRSARS